MDVDDDHNDHDDNNDDHDDIDDDDNNGDGNGSVMMTAHTTCYQSVPPIPLHNYFLLSKSFRLIKVVIVL